MAALLINGVPATCIIKAAHQYYLPVSLLISILMTENGRVGQANKNKNGTYDYGPMQINSVWLKKVGRYGYTEKDLQYNACDNVKVGAWILAQEVAKGTTFWQGVGDYHSHTYYQNHRYDHRVQHYYYFLVKALSSSDAVK